MKRLAAAALCLSGCAQGPAPGGAKEVFDRATPFCTLMADPMPHVGQPVLVSGLYVASPHGGLIYSADCETREIELHGEVGLKHDKRAERIWDRALRRDDSVRVPVVYRGVLAARHFIATCPAIGCWRFSIERAQLVAAREPDGPR
jgi:hypothetical protein